MNASADLLPGTLDVAGLLSRSELNAKRPEI
jgi:hypothetical protein